MHIFSLIFLILGSQQLLARTQWTKFIDGDGRCATTCGRAGMDDVYIPSGVALPSICAGLDDSIGKIVIGVQTRKKSAHCELATDRKVSTPTKFCLCAHDGTLAGTDIKSFPSIDQQRCDTTCRKEGEKGFGYAIYGSYLQKGWSHLCVQQSGRIGFLGGDTLGCRANGISELTFNCLCSRSFSGDLDPTKDP